MLNNTNQSGKAEVSKQNMMFVFSTCEQNTFRLKTYKPTKKEMKNCNENKTLDH